MSESIEIQKAKSALAEAGILANNLHLRLIGGEKRLRENISKLRDEMSELGYREQTNNEMLIGAYTVALEAFGFGSECHNKQNAADAKKLRR